MRTLLALAFLAIGCQSSGDDPVTVNDAGVIDSGSSDSATVDSAPSKDSGVGAGGGVVTSADGRARITIPPGALASDTGITITPGSASAMAVASGIYEFGPSGLSFEKDAEVCLAIDGEAPRNACLGYLDGSGKWVCEDLCLKKDGGMLCGSTHHFTSFAILLSGGRGTDAACADAALPPSGGTLTSTDGFAELTVPAGVATTKTRYTIAVAPGTAARGFGSATYELFPDGKFAANVDLCVKPLAGSDTALACLAYLDAAGGWVCEDKCLEKKGDRLCGSTSHFTSFAILLSGGSGSACP